MRNRFMLDVNLLRWADLAGGFGDARAANLEWKFTAEAKQKTIAEAKQEIIAATLSTASTAGFAQGVTEE